MRLMSVVVAELTPSALSAVLAAVQGMANWTCPACGRPHRDRLTYRTSELRCDEPSCRKRYRRFELVQQGQQR